MKKRIFFITYFFFLFCSCYINNSHNSTKNICLDSILLRKMVNEREKAMKNKDLATLMLQFSDDATFINTSGYYYSSKKEIKKFHERLLFIDSVSYHYQVGNIHVRLLDPRNALVYYTWQMLWFYNTNPKDTVRKEVGLMTLSAQKRDKQWYWIAITNQNTPQFFQDIQTHKR